MNSTVIILAKTLMSRPSITPNDGGCQDLIISYLEPLGFKCEKMRFGSVDNLFARLGDQGPLLLFAGHTDVVPTGPLEDWTSPPFTPEIRDNYLYGRGASDMKAAIAAMVIATQEFVKAHPQFRGSIAFLLTSDEEGPSIDGTKKVIEVLQQRGVKIDYCIIGEPSSISHVGDQIRVGRRGSLHGKLTIHGKQGHVAHPHLAINPIHLSMMALHELAHTTWDEGNDDFPATTMQISNIHSGTGAANVIPGHLECQFNFRFGTVITPQQLMDRATAIFNKTGLAFDIDWHVSAEPFLIPRAKLTQAVQQAIKEITNRETRLSTGGGTSDGRFIAKTGAEIVELGTSHATAHQVDESVNVEDLEQLTKIYQHVLKNVF